MGFFINYQYIFMIMAIFFGLAMGQSSTVADTASKIIVPFLMVMLWVFFTNTI